MHLINYNTVYKQCLVSTPQSTADSKVCGERGEDDMQSARIYHVATFHGATHHSLEDNPATHNTGPHPSVLCVLQPAAFHLAPQPAKQRLSFLLFDETPEHHPLPL